MPNRLTKIKFYSKPRRKTLTNDVKCTWLIEPMKTNKCLTFAYFLTRRVVVYTQQDLSFAAPFRPTSSPVPAFRHCIGCGCELLFITGNQQRRQSGDELGFSYSEPIRPTPTVWLGSNWPAAYRPHPERSSSEESRPPITTAKAAVPNSRMSVLSPSHAAHRPPVISPSATRDLFAHKKLEAQLLHLAPWYSSDLAVFIYFICQLF